MRRRAKKPRNDLEHQLQTAFFQWLAIQHPTIHKVSFAIPNAAKRSFVTAAKLKDEGLKAGVPDVLLCVPHGTYAGFFIEFKIKPNKPTDLQVAMMAELTANGYRCEVIYDLDSAISFVNDYITK